MRADTRARRDRDRDRQPTIGRRSALAILASVFGVGVATQPAAAQQLNENDECTWQVDVDAQDHTLRRLASIALTGQGTPIESFTGDGLSIDGDGNLTAGASGGGASAAGSDGEFQINNGGNIDATSKVAYDWQANEISAWPPFNSPVDYLMPIRTQSTIEDASNGNTIYGVGSQQFGSGNESADLASIKATGLFNKDIGDSVDYSDPFWLAKTEHIVDIFQAMSIDGLSQSTSGGSVSLSSGRGALRVETNSSSGNSAKATKENALPSGSFDDDLVASLATRNTDASAQTLYWTIGSPADGNAGIGVKISNDQRLAVAHDGNSETTATIETTSTFDNPVLIVEFTAGSELIVTNTATNNKATISSGLPSGFTGGSQNQWQVYAEASEDNNKVAELRGSTFVRRR